jgi:peptidyl-prolyl cis-trans isomerase SurA
MKRTGLIILTLLMFCGTLSAQQEKPLLLIHGEEIFADEFMNVFLKNSTNKSATKEEIDDYLELYINFRLKVAEAKEMKLDTQQTFKTELEGYRKTLAMPYLTKTEILDKLVDEAYERMQWDIRASHILINVSPYASPADTLKAYKKAMNIRTRALKGESFQQLAIEFSDDESAHGNNGTQRGDGNQGDLGYFSALDLVYDFENTAFSLKVGDISMPVRSEFGYHVIKLTDRKPALGRVQTAHILIAVSPDAADTELSDAEKKINDLYDRIMSGESFEELAKEYSDDKGSGMRGGVLPWFGVFRMLPEFIEPLYGMQAGQITKPVLTPYGYHIIKLIERKPVSSYDELKSDLKNRVMRDSRYEKATKSFVEKLKQENGFQQFPDALKKFNAAVNDSIFNGTWSAEMMQGFEAPLFITGNKTYTQTDFALFVERNQFIEEGADKDTYLNKLFEKFVNERVIAYENENLENKHPAFATLMKEYHDGILLFDLTDRMVWSKALKDTTGLQAFYETIKFNYMWPDRVEGTIYYVQDLTTAKKFHKALSKASRKGADLSQIADSFNSGDNILITEESGIYIKSEHPVFSSIQATGIGKPYEKDGKFLVVKTDRLISPEPKALREVRGVVTNEYQNHLEKEWIKELRSKYQWKVNQDVLKTLYK